MSFILSSRNILKSLPKIILRIRKISLKKVTYYFSYTAASYNYNNIYNIVVAL
jgi:hypothetical protein